MLYYVYTTCIFINITWQYYTAFQCFCSYLESFPVTYVYMHAYVHKTIYAGEYILNLYIICYIHTIMKNTFYL